MFAPVTRFGSPRQTAVGLALAVAIIGAWLAVHIYGVFFWRWTPATTPIAVLLVLGRDLARSRHVHRGA